MLKKFRRSSGTVTLVLIGMAALSGCSGEKRDVYASKEDCLADWGNKPEDCTPSTDPKHANRGYFYGPLYAGAGYLAGRTWGNSTGTFSAARGSGGSRSIGSTGSSSRGGFGSTGRSSSSSS